MVSYSYFCFFHLFHQRYLLKGFELLYILVRTSPLLGNGVGGYTLLNIPILDNGLKRVTVFRPRVIYIICFINFSILFKNLFRWLAKFSAETLSLPTCCCAKTPYIISVSFANLWFLFKSNRL